MPFLRLRRTGAAVAGAALMIATGSLGPVAALRAIDLRTLLLLFAMMALVAPLRITGAIGRLARRASDAVRHPAALVAAVVVASGVLSAIFINDTICIVFTPVVLELAALRRHRPLPYLVALATASNIGSVATMIGNPQNILIGSVSRMGFWTFARALTPVALVGFAIDTAVIWFLFRRELHETAEDAVAATPGGPEGAVSRGPEGPHYRGRWWAAIDWHLLLLFAALFIVVAGAERAGVDRRLFELLQPLGMQTLAGLSAAAAVLSNIVSNVPAVMLFTPLVPHLPDPGRAWLALAMSSTLAGNLTVLGSIANLIVIEGARRRGAHVGYGDYLKAGIPVTVLTLAFGVYWLT